MKIAILDWDGSLFDTHGSGALYPDVSDVLEELCRDCKVILLTVGDKEVQLAKLAQCGVTDSFNEIVVVRDGPDKAHALKVLVKQYASNDSSVYVVGDRVDLEVLYGNRLGLTTVRIRRPQGKYSGLEPRLAHEHPTYEITSFQELLKILEND